MRTLTAPGAVLAATAVALWGLAFGLFGAPAHTLGAHPDIFQFFNWINALDHGQMPSRDFHTPAGMLTHYLPYWGYRLAGQYAGAMEMASLLALAALLPCAAAALAGRVSTLVGVAVLVATAALIAVPWNPGDGVLVASQFLFYNRWCWAALGALFLFHLPKRQPRFGVVEGLVVATLLLFLFLVKIPYFAVGAVFVAVFGIGFRRFRRAAAQGFALFALAVAGLQAFTGVVDDYLGDVRGALNATGFVWAGAGSPFAVNLLGSWSQYAALVIAWAVVASGGGLRRSDWAFLGYAVISSMLILGQNGAQSCVFALVAGHLCLLARGTGPRRAVAGWALVVFLLPSLCAQGLASHVFATKHAHYQPVALPRMDGLHFFASAEPDFIHHLESGVALLQGNDIQSGALMSLDFASWFPVFLDIAPVHGRMWCFHVGRSIDFDTAPSAVEIFANVRHIMVPKFGRSRLTPLTPPQEAPATALARTSRMSSRDFLLAVYGDHVAAAYRVARENEHWWLLGLRRDLERRDPVAARSIRG